MVGVAGTVTQQARAFVTIDGIMTDLNVFLPTGSGWELHYARAINDAGQIIGQAIPPARVKYGVHCRSLRK